MDEIRNKVKESGIISMDLADFKPKCTIMGIDIADQLWQRMVLKEKDFRNWIRSTDWSIYANQCVYIHCSVEAIIPTWAYMLIASELNTVNSNYVVGSKSDLERKLISEEIKKIDLTALEDARVIIKGCSDIVDPAYAMTEVMKRIHPVVRSIMYGEPCSAVPIFKRK